MTIKVNPDKDEAARIRQAIKDNDGYCPCRITRAEDTKCMCKEFLESETDGWCHCGLYYKKLD